MDRGDIVFTNHRTMSEERMRLCNDASIVRALADMCSTIEHSPKAGRWSLAVLSRIPGDGAPSLLHRVGQAMEIQSVMLRIPPTDDFDEAVLNDVLEHLSGMDRPMLLILDDAHEAPPGSVAMVARMVAQSRSAHPCLLMAITTTTAERRISGELAQGADCTERDVTMHRTIDEELRLVRRMARAMK